MSTTINWSNRIGSRSRGSWLLFVKGDEVIVFRGQNIPGVVVVRDATYTKGGKWSCTAYRLEVADSVRYIAGRDGWNTGRFIEGLAKALGKHETPDTWVGTAELLGVSVPSAMEFLREWRPKAADKLDEVEQALVDLEEASAQQETDSVTVTVSFGSPSNRARREGYWESPKRIPGYNAEIRLKDPEGGWTEGNIEVVGISGSVLSVKHARGSHGGYYAVSVAVMPGSETELPPFETAREKAARESGLPEKLHLAFDGDEEKIKTFMEKVSKLDVSKLDEHEMSCGRDRKREEVIRVSGDPDFFLGADPLEVCWYITKGDVSGPSQVGESSSSGNPTLGDALKRAGY